MLSKIESFAAQIEREVGLKLEGLRKKAFIEGLNKLRVEREEDLDTLIKTLKENEKQELVESILVGETYFMRERYHFEILRDEVLPLMKAGKLPRKVLSAGCSTGEEVYSIRFVMVDNGADYPVLGLDISRRAIDIARSAVYRKNSMRRLSEDEINRWFVREGELFKVREHYRKNAIFKVANLLNLDEDIKKEAPFGAVFLRNVLMYFTLPAREKVMSDIIELVAPQGYVFLGTSESIGYAWRGLEAEQKGGVVYFIKRDKPEKKAPVQKIDGLDANLEDRMLLLYLEGKWYEFEENLRRLKARGELSPFIPFFESLLLEVKGNLTGALEALRRSLYLDPSFYLAYWQKGRIYEVLGDREKSLNAYRKALKLLKTDTYKLSVDWFKPKFLKKFLEKKIEEV